MKFGNDSSTNVDNSGTNNGIQIGNNTGTFILNQGLSTGDLEALLNQIGGQCITKKEASQENIQHNSTFEHKWYRSDTGEEIRPDQLLKNGNTTAQIDGNITRAEILLPNGKTMYTEYDIETNGINLVKTDGFPEEYEIKIPPELIIKKLQGFFTVQNKNYPAEKFILKFGGYLVAVYDINEHKLLEFDAHAPAGMMAHIDVNTKQITFIDK